MPITLTKDVGNSDYAVEIDPTSQHEKNGINPFEIFETLGLIPQFMFNDQFLDQPAWEALNNQYQHGGGLRKMDGTITAEGVYQYPGDPDLYPIAKYTRADETIWQYPHGIMAIPKDGTLTLTRMD